MATETANPRIAEVTGPIEVPVVNRAGESVGTVTVDPAAFGGKINKQLMHDVVLMHLANQRAGTHSTLRRGEVAGSTKKLFRQKGTGRARAGTKRTNKRRGGGTAKGPKPRDYEYHLPKRAVKLATRMALLSKFRDKEAIVLDDTLKLEAPKTKEVAGILKAIKVSDTTCLIGTAGLSVDEQRIVYKSARNIRGVEIFPATELNTYFLLRQKKLVLTRAAFEAICKPAAS
jgi:large subunit ribosomal protein L4